MTAYAMTSPAISRPVPAIVRSSSRPASVQPRRGSVRVHMIDTPAARARRRGILVVVLLALGAFLAPQAFANDSSEIPVVLDTYTVGQGETMWEIASSIAPAGVDVRDVVADILTVNAMTDSALQAGQQLRLPVID
ncbi:LysM peptidoglycan-binding domain-containing protein [uncultured Demequina sp.]|uniref:LysM peptidoglycan-binding domain-containing protein n=1 Tax=uncultured Demequina sp. TaxID=693499 RepID=UPI0025FEFCB1|nr:LysM peptidoglycan-binding domain-containing protein [uncultured Demequina sp.]